MASSRRQPKAKSKRRSFSRRRPVIGCVIFDLDDTLYDCFGQRVRPAHRQAARAMNAAGLHGTVDAVYRARMKAFRKDPTLRHIDAEVCRRFQADDPERISRAARDAYFNCPVGKLRLFAGTRPLLHFLRAHGVRSFVVSFGEPKIQHAKVKVLGLDHERSLERIIYADRDKLVTKESAFKEIQKRVGLPAGQMLVVGDRPLSEIRAGNDLGMHTVRVHRGEFAAQKPASKKEKSDYVVSNIAEVRRLPFLWGARDKS